MEGGTARCPGENDCTPFKIARSETGNGLDACNGCVLLPTKRVAGEESASDDVDLMVWQTEMLIGEEDGGFAIDWDFHEPELSELVIEWRRAEKDLKLLFDVRQQQFIKAHFKKE